MYSTGDDGRILVLVQVDVYSPACPYGSFLFYSHTMSPPACQFALYLFLYVCQTQTPNGAPEMMLAMPY
jgi:hypothetical protein